MQSRDFHAFESEPKKTRNTRVSSRVNRFKADHTIKNTDLNDEEVYSNPKSVLSKSPALEVRPNTDRSVKYVGIPRPLRSHELENMKYFKQNSVDRRKGPSSISINTASSIYSNTENSFKTLDTSSDSSVNSLDKTKISSLEKTGLAKFDEDSSDEDDLESRSKSKTLYTIEESPSFDLDQTPTDEYIINDEIISLFQEMEQFQQYVNKKNPTPLPMNRTTRKMNDYRDLTSSIPRNDSFQFLNTYNIKIQHEKIISQYTSLRCRFPSKVPVSSLRNSTLKTDTGIWGYLNRHHSMPKTFNTLQKYPVDNEKTRSYLESIWNKQLPMFNIDD